MVGFVIVSHSETLAKGVVELTKMMADDVPIGPQVVWMMEALAQVLRRFQMQLRKSIRMTE